MIVSTPNHAAPKNAACVESCWTPSINPPPYGGQDSPITRDRLRNQANARWKNRQFQNWPPPLLANGVWRWSNRGMVEKKCPFCNLADGRIYLENDVAAALPDAFPVVRGPHPGRPQTARRQHFRPFRRGTSRHLEARCPGAGRSSGMTWPPMLSTSGSTTARRRARRSCTPTSTLSHAAKAIPLTREAAFVG